MYWLKESLRDLKHEFSSKKRAIKQLDPAIIKHCTITEIVRKLTDCSGALAGEPGMARPRLIDESTADPEYRSKLYCRWSFCPGIENLGSSLSPRIGCRTV